MTDPDPDLAARLRELSEQRIAAKIQAAKRQAQQRKQTRQQFARNRDHGLTQRHAIRQQMIARHDQQQGDQQS